MLNGYVVAVVAPLLVTADRYRPARRALGPLLLVASLSFLAGIGSLLAMALA